MNISSMGRAVLKYKIHWHLMLVHFPISLFGVAFLFQILHLFINPFCFELGTNVTLAAGSVMMIPTTWSGWSSWKNQYKGAKVKLFQRKITIAFSMLSLSVIFSRMAIYFIWLF